MNFTPFKQFRTQSKDRTTERSSSFCESDRKRDANFFCYQSLFNCRWSTFSKPLLLASHTIRIGLPLSEVSTKICLSSLWIVKNDFCALSWIPSDMFFYANLKGRQVVKRSLWNFLNWITATKNDLECFDFVHGTRLDNSWTLLLFSLHSQ